MSETDLQTFINAIHRALDGGTIAAPPIPGRPSDENYLRTQLNIGIDEAVLDEYIRELRAIPQLAALDTGVFASTPLGGGMSTDLPSLGRLVLARAISTNDIEGTAESFATFIERNSAPSIAILTISGISVDAELQLGLDVKLVHVTSLPPSGQRGLVLGQDPYLRHLAPTDAFVALTANFDFGPVFFLPSAEPTVGAANEYRKAESLLDEARLLFGLIGIFPAAQMQWAQSQDLLMNLGIGVWQIHDRGANRRVEHVQAGAIENIASRYFALEEGVREKFLRIPLDRLNRAGREADVTDCAIDLGIALEALLLHQVGSSKDRGELKYRLTHRGGWLGGKNPDERLEIKNVLGKVYDLRSEAVHSGTVKDEAKGRETLRRGAQICQDLIRAVIDRRCEVDWDRLVMGLDAEAEHSSPNPSDERPDS